MKVFLGADNKSVSAVLKMYRKAHNLTQQKVADYLGLDRTTYSKYETMRRPEIDVILKLSLLYEISLDDFMSPFFKDSDSPSALVTVDSPKPEKLERISSEEEKLLMLYRNSIRKAEIMKTAENIFNRDNDIIDEIRDDK